LKRPTNLQYANDEVPPPLTVGILAVQHSAIVLIHLVYVVIISKSLGLSAQAQFAMLSSTLMVSGVATALQAKFGSGLLIVFFSNPIYIPFIIAAGTLAGLPGIAFMLLCAGVLEFLFGSSVRRLRAFFPPEVCGVVVIMLGVSLLPGALRGVATTDAVKSVMQVDPAALTVALLTLAVASAGSVWLKGTARSFSLLMGCAAGILLALRLGVGQLHNVASHSGLSWLALPQLYFPGFTASAGLFTLALVAAMVNAVDSLGVLIGTERLDDADWQIPKFSKLSRGLQASGMATAVSAVTGGCAMGMSSANLSLAYATGATSRVIGLATGAILIGVSFMPFALEHVLAIPDAVVAGIIFFAASYFVVSGADLALSRMLSPRRALVIGLPVGAGILLQSAPAMTAPLAGSSLGHLLAPMTFASVLAVILNLLMRIGIGQIEKTSFVGVADGEKAEKFVEMLCERWGTHRRVGLHASSVMSECLEALGSKAKSPIECSVEYNELLFIITFSYEGEIVTIPQVQPSIDEITDGADGLERMSLWLVQKLADWVTVTSSGNRHHLRVSFEC